MARWRGLSVASLKQHQELIPLFGALGFGMALCGTYLGRLIFMNPDVAWNRKANPEPWNKWQQSDKFKFLSTRDHKNRGFPEERPDMSTEKYKGI